MRPTNIRFYTAVYWCFTTKAICLGVLMAWLSVANCANAQTFWVTGTLADSVSRQPLVGANIHLANQHTLTTASGSFKFKLNPGTYNLKASFAGYQTLSKQVHVNAPLQLLLYLKPGTQLAEVTVKGVTMATQSIANAQSGLNNLRAADINAIPVLLGERDVIKAIELLPGVKTTGDANTGFYVRGGGADQNLILLDGATLYNASHLFGFFSSFNQDVVNDVSLYKGSIPPGFGGRLSSVLDVHSIDGNDSSWRVKGGIGFIASRVEADGPIIKNKCSVVVAARRTYGDLFLKLSADTLLNQSSLYFYDVNVRLNYRFNTHNGLYISTYLGTDHIGVGSQFGTSWGNTVVSVRYNHLWGSSGKWASNTVYTYSKYNFEVASYQSLNDYKVESDVGEHALRHEFEWNPTPSHLLHFGAVINWHSITPGVITTSASSSYNSSQLPNHYATEYTLFAAHEWQISPKLNLQYGLRLNDFAVMGPGTFKTYDTDGYIISSVDYSRGQLVKNYFNAEPRLAVALMLNSQSSVKGAYTVNTQNIHLLSNSTSSFPSDVYLMSSNNVKPGLSQQLSGGYFRQSSEGNYEFSAEVYYKWLSNEIDYRNNAQLQNNENLEALLLYGTGRAYGLELFFKKRRGRLTGWVGYTLSRTERRFDGINNGAYFPARQDRTHDVSVVGQYKINSRLSLSSVFVYGTGNAVTYPVGKYRVGGLTTFYYTNRNASRLPPDNRLDIGLTVDGKMHQHYHSSITVSVYNVYNRKNPYSVVFKDSATSPPHTEAVETSLFGIIPALTWDFRFK